jgi:hypothetical protein
MVAPQGGMASPISLAQAQGQQFQAFPRAPQQPLTAHHQDQISSPQSMTRPPQAPALPASGLPSGPLIQQQNFASSFANDATKQHLTSAQSASSYYPSPFQRHYDQLGKSRVSRALLFCSEIMESLPLNQQSKNTTRSIRAPYLMTLMSTSISHTPRSQQPMPKKHMRSDMAANRPHWHLRLNRRLQQTIITLDNFLSRSLHKPPMSRLSPWLNRRAIRLRSWMDNSIITV